MMPPDDASAWPRRQFLSRVGASLCVAPLLLDARSAAGATLSAAGLLVELEQASASLRAGTIDGYGWQARVEGLLALADHQDLRAAITLDWRAVDRDTKTRGQSARALGSGQLRGCPAEPSFRAKLFAFRAGHAIVPHGHRNLVSAFVALDGQFRGRHYDRLRDEPDAIVIRPTDDRRFVPGDAAAISEQRDNVHWFTALDDHAILFNVGVTLPAHLQAMSGVGRSHTTERTYLDPEGELLADGSIRAPRATLSTLRAKYQG